MAKVNFNNGVLKLNPENEYDKDTAAYLAFNQSNEDHKKYDALEKALPRIVGLRNKKYRARYVFDVMQALNANGYEIIKKEDK